jgi:hypothetical protein
MGSSNVYETMVSTMSDEDVLVMWHACVKEHKRRLEEKQTENKRFLKVGDRVKWGIHGRTGEITKVKRVKAYVRDDWGSCWDIRLSSLTKI